MPLSRFPRTASAAALATLALAACHRDDAPRADSAVAAPAASPSAATASAPAAADACPETGLWVRCNVEKRLERAGLVATPLPDTLHVKLFSVPGLHYDLGRGELQVYLYPDSMARRRETSALDSARVARPGAAAPWSTQATLITSGNMAAVFLGVNETQAERVGLALGAGLPAK